MTSHLSVEARQTRVFELIGQGYTHAQICKALKISQDTLARDVKAIAEQVKQVLGGRREAVIAEALAHYQQVVQMAWQEYRAELKRERDWFGGKLDYPTEQVTTKTLARDDEDDDGLSAIADESAPLEVQRVQKRLRPGQPSSAVRKQWLDLVVTTTREITELFGIKKLTIEHQGQNGGPLKIVVTYDDTDDQAAEPASGPTDR
jgi:transposase